MSRRFPKWQKVCADFSARYFANGRTEVMRESTQDIVVSYSPSLQDDMIMGRYKAALRYLFGPDILAD